MGGRNAMYFASKRPEVVQKLVIVDIGPEISARASQAPAGPPEPEFWDSIEQAAQHLLRGNPYPGIHYYRWVAAQSLRQGPDGRIAWAWHPSVKTHRSTVDVDWWAVLRSIPVPTLVLRGEDSDLLLESTVRRMQERGPHVELVQFPGIGHAPWLMSGEQIGAVRKFLLAPELSKSDR